MKKKKFLYSAVSILFLFTACRKLDVPIESQYNISNFPTTPAGYQAVIGPLYTQLAYSPTGGWSYAVEYWRMQELSTDEAIIPARDGNYDDGGQYRFLHKHTWNADHPNVIGGWQWGFGGVNICNQLLNLFAIAPPSNTKAASIAEVRAMRCLFTFLMMDLYGNVPIIDTFPVVKLPATSPRADVFAFIEKNLKLAIPDLSAATGTATYGRATKWMAFALLEKMYLNAEYYTGTPRYADAVAMADSILIGGAFSLDASFGSIFAPTNGPQIKETIFAVPYDANLIPGNHFTRFGLLPYLKDKYSLPFRSSIALSTIPEFFLNNFTLSGDARDTFWIRGKQYNFNGTPVIYATTQKTLDNTYVGADYKINWQVEIFDTLKLRTDPEKMDVGNDLIGQCSGIRSIKYYPDPNANSSSRYQGNDVPLLRLADVILMKSEAILRGAAATTVNGELQTPLVLLNKIRKRSNAPLAASVDLPGLLQERAREFSWEAWRRNDLIRFGKFEDAWGFKTNAETYRRIFPVPTKEIALNPNLKQNPGYK
jgi:hypothetical protein